MQIHVDGYTVVDDEDDDPTLLDPAGIAVDTWRENYPYEHRMTDPPTMEQNTSPQAELRKLQT